MASDILFLVDVVAAFLLLLEPSAGCGHPRGANAVNSPDTPLQQIAHAPRTAREPGQRRRRDA